MSLQKKLDGSKESVSTSLRALQSITTSPPPKALPPLLPGLAESFAQLLTKLHHNITALSLSFKPPITTKAAIAQLEKVEDDFGRIAACVVASAAGETGGSLVEEWKDGTESIGAEIIRLLDVFVEAEKQERSGASKSASSSKDDNPYLLHTGLVWDRIDRLSEKLSHTEVAAVSKKWLGHGEVMKDAWQEFKEYLEDQEDDEDENLEDEDDIDDEFADLDDIMKGGKMSADERARAERAKPLLGLHQILHSTLPRYLPLLILDPEESYSNLLEASSSLTAAFDSAVEAMYPEQEPKNIDHCLADLADRSRSLANSFQTRLDRVRTDEARRATCSTFIRRWTDRLLKEEDEWKEISVKSLQLAL